MYCIYNILPLYLILIFTLYYYSLYFIKTSSVKLNFCTRNISLLYSCIYLHTSKFDFELSNR